MTTLGSVLLGIGMMTYANQPTVEQVLANRLEWGQIDPIVDHIGYIAYWDEDMIGETVWIRLPDGESVGPLLVYDVPAEQDKAWLKARGWTACLDQTTWTHLGLPEDDVVRGVEVWTGLPRVVNKHVE